MKIPILFVNSTPEHGGANILLIDMLRHLDLAKYRPVIVSPPQKVEQTANFEQFEGPVETVQLGVLKRSNNPFKILRFLWLTVTGARRLVRLIKDERVQIVHTNSSTVISGALAAKISGVHSVVHVHEVISPRWARFLLSIPIFALADQVVVISHTVRDQFPSRLRDRVEVVYDGVDLKKFKPRAVSENINMRTRLGVPGQAPLIGTVARFTPWKGQEVFIRACADLAEEYPQAQFIMAGQTFEELSRYVHNLKRLAKELNLEERMKFEFWHPDITGLMSALDIFVHTSVKPEAFGLVVIEAMALKKPVIGTIGGVREIISDHVGSVVSPGDHLALSEAIKQMLGDREAAKTMGIKGQDRVTQLFNITRTSRKFESIYQNLLRENHVQKTVGQKESI